MDERKETMLSMRHNDLMTLQQIGDAFGISRERVRQIIGNTGWSSMKRKHSIRNSKIKGSVKSTPVLAEEFNLSYGFTSSIRGRTYHKVVGDAGTKGQDAEIYVSKMLDEVGIPNELMPVHHSFDIKTWGDIRIDVKSSFSPRVYERHNNPRWGFNIASKKRGRYCDFFVLVIYPSKDCFIVPFDVVGENADTIFFCWPSDRPEIGKYQQYQNRWDLILTQAFEYPEVEQ